VFTPETIRNDKNQMIDTQRRVQPACFDFCTPNSDRLCAEN